MEAEKSLWQGLKPAFFLMASRGRKELSIPYCLSKPKADTLEFNLGYWQGYYR